MSLEILGFGGFVVSALFFFKSWVLSDLRVVFTVLVGLTIPVVLFLSAEEESASLAQVGVLTATMTKESVLSMLQDAFI